MKKILVSLLVLWSTAGCVTTQDPAIDMMNEQFLIGEWELFLVVFPNKKTRRIADGKLSIRFYSNKDFDFISEQEDIEEIKNLVMKYAVKGNKLKIMMFERNQHIGTFNGQYQFWSSFELRIHNISLRDTNLGNINLNALFPDTNLRKMSFLFLKKEPETK